MSANKPRHDREIDDFIANEVTKEVVLPQDGPNPIRRLPGQGSAQPLMTLRRIVPPTDTITIGDEIHVLRPLMSMSIEDQIVVSNDRNAELDIRRRIQERDETLTQEEKDHIPFYQKRIVLAAIPTAPEWMFLSPDEGGLLPEQVEALIGLFFTRSIELRSLLGQTVERPTSPASSPDSSASTAATPATGSSSPATGSTSSRATSRASKRRSS